MFTEALNRIWEFISTPLTIGVSTLSFSIIDLTLAFVFPFFISLILLILLRKGLLKALERSNLTETHKKVTSKVMRIVFRLLIIVLFILIMTPLLGEDLTWFFTAIDFLNEPIFMSGELSITIITLTGAILIFLLSSWVGKGVRRIMETEVFRRLPMNSSLRFSLSNILGYSTTLIMVIIGLRLIGINFSSLVVLFGVLGIGIGFGLQNTVANFFAGLIIIISRPIKEGDFILVKSVEESKEGRVVKITLLHSIINTLLNETIIIPNSEIINKPVHNLSHGSSEIIAVVSVQVHYQTDIDRVEELLIALARKCPHWNQKNEATMMIRDFASSGIELNLFVHISRAQERFRARGWLRREIWRCFREEGIVIPYPQLDLHVRNP